MGYQDGLGLRPGRSVNRLQSDVGSSNYLGTSRAVGGNYRAAGAISPIRPSQSLPQTVPTPEVSPVKPPKISTVSPQESALFQYTAPDYTMPSVQMPNFPKSPGIGQQIAMGVGSKVAGEMVGRGINAALGSFSAPSAPYSLSGASNFSSPVNAANVSSGFDIAPNVSGDFGGSVGSAASGAYDPGWNPDYSFGSTAGSVASGAWDLPAISETALFEGGSAAADGASAAGGLSDAVPYVPYIPAVAKLVQGDVGGAAKTAAGTAVGTAVGNAVLPVVGGAVGGVIGSVVGGGSVICTELARCKEVSDYQMSLEMHYATTVNKTVLRGYRYWAVPVVKKMRKTRVVYKLARAIALRFMQESRARLGYGEQSLLGIVAIPLCYAICWIIGTFVNDVDYQSLFVKEQK